MAHLPDEGLLVEDALQPAKYRVYADTPLSEVVDLMVRREIRAVPVVGERYEVLGIITTGDALVQVLRENPGDESEGEGRQEALTARDVMTRSVLCVSETQKLTDAARMMVNRSVDLLPVVREGELIGLITRDAILSALHAELHPTDQETKDVT
jgi:CBS domain-containing protein